MFPSAVTGEFDKDPVKVDCEDAVKGTVTRAGTYREALVPRTLFSKSTGKGGGGDWVTPSLSGA